MLEKVLHKGTLRSSEDHRTGPRARFGKERTFVHVKAGTATPANTMAPTAHLPPK